MWKSIYQILYRAVILMIIFVASFLFFMKGLKSNEYESGVVVQPKTETLPIVTTTVQGCYVNAMYGYNGPIADNVVRESITPLNQDKNLSLTWTDTELKPMKVGVAIKGCNSLETLYEKEYGNLDQSGRKLELTLDYGFQTTTEYILSLVFTMESGRKVHYYTRVKYYENDTHLADKLNFAMNIHEMTLDPMKQEMLSEYLETDGSDKKTSLATVTIKSDPSQVTWESMEPEVISEIVPVVKEFNTETACFLLDYFVRAKTPAGKEIFEVQEFYRVRHAGNEDYLLNFERRLEADFKASHADVDDGMLKMGITNDTKSKILSAVDQGYLYFARGGNLYCYNTKTSKNTVERIYSFYSEDKAYSYRQGPGQSIRLLKTLENGDLYFAAYGYFPRGNYEGKVAIVIHCYHAEEKKLEELLYLPMDTTYEQLKEDFEEYGYVTAQNVYHFIVAGNVYSYHFDARRLITRREEIQNNNFQVIQDTNFYAWLEENQLVLFNLETEEQKVVTPPAENEKIRLLGTINDNVIYGFCRGEDGVWSGEIPCYKIMISDCEGNVRKTYEAADVYVTGVEVAGNVMTLRRVKKVGDTYEKIGNDSILNQNESKSAGYSMSPKSNTQTLTEWYVRISASYTMSDKPKEKDLKLPIITGGRSVHLDEKSQEKYYVYALGVITDSTDDPAKAIQLADEKMGVVVSGAHQVIWERSGAFLMNSIAGLEGKKSGGHLTDASACAYMVLKANHYSPKEETLSKDHDNITKMLRKYMDHVMNLSGVTLDQVLYMVSSDHYVIGKTSDTTAVVICGYDEGHLTICDPADGKIKTVDRKEMEKTFKEAQNRFISYT